MTTPQLLNLGLSGFSLAGADVGGFAGSPSPDLLTKWLKLAAFQPIDRDHAAKGTRPHEPWVDGPEQEAIRRRYIEERYRLMPYLYTTAEETSRTGIPIIRPLFLEFPHATTDGHPLDLDAPRRILLRPRHPRRRNPPPRRGRPLRSPPSPRRLVRLLDQRKARPPRNPHLPRPRNPQPHRHRQAHTPAPHGPPRPRRSPHLRPRRRHHPHAAARAIHRRETQRPANPPRLRTRRHLRALLRRSLHRRRPHLRLPPRRLPPPPPNLHPLTPTAPSPSPSPPAKAPSTPGGPTSASKP